MDHDAERVHGVTVDEHVQLDQRVAAVSRELVVQRAVAAGDGLELVVEVQNDLRERELPVELHARGVEVLHAEILPAPLLPQLHDRADVVGRRGDARLDIGLLHPVHL